jgi:hypothetical protein
MPTKSLLKPISAPDRKFLNTPLFIVMNTAKKYSQTCYVYGVLLFVVGVFTFGPQRNQWYAFVVATLDN